MSYSHCTLSEFLISKEDGRTIISLFTSRPTPLEEKNLGRLFALMEVEIVDEVYEEVLDIIANEINNQYYQSEAFDVDTAFEYALQHLNTKIQEIVGDVGSEWLDSSNMVIGVQKGKQIVFTHIGRVISLLAHGDKVMDVIDTTASKAETINPVKVFTNVVSGEVSNHGTILFSTETMLDYLSKEKIKRVIQMDTIKNTISEFHTILEEDTIDHNFCGILLRHELVEKKEDARTEIPVVNTAAATTTTGMAKTDELGDETDSMSELVNRQHETEELLSPSLWSSMKKSMRASVDRMKENRDTRRESEDEEEKTVYSVEKDALLGGDSEHGPDVETPLSANMAQLAVREAEERKKRVTGDEDADLNSESSRTPTIGELTSDAILDEADTDEEDALEEKEGGKAGGMAADTAKKAAGMAGTAGVAAAGGLFKVFKVIGAWFGELFKALWDALRSRRAGGTADIRHRGSRAGRRTTAQALGNAIASVILGLVNWFLRLSLARKVLFVVAVVVLVLFARSVVNTGEQQITDDQEQAYAEVLSEVDVKVNEGKAAIIFDKDNARELFVEARELLASVPEESEAYQLRGEELQNLISAELEEVNNVVTVNPTVAIDYNTISPDLSLGNTILLGASMYAFDSNSQSAYRGNLESDSTSVSLNSTGGARYVEVVKASPGTGIALLDDQTASTFQPIAESLSPLDLSWPVTETQFVDVGVFGTRMYLLDVRNNQIYRHTQDGDTFGAGTEWLNDAGVDLSNAAAMAIDGNIFVMKSDGSVIKLFGGTKDTEFSLSTIEPALTSGTELFTDEDTEHLYILDAPGKRVVQFTKEGEFVAQYRSDSFTDMKDIIVDEAQNKMYVLNGAQLLEIAIQQADTAENTEEPADNAEARAGLQG